MSDNYNLYYKWFGIRPEEMPTNAYRLLGVQVFEPDDDVIANAVQQRTSYLRSFLTSEDGATAQQILDEFKQIEVCLLNPETKATYDEQLRGFLALQPQPEPSHLQPPPSNSAEPPIDRAFATGISDSPTESTAPAFVPTTRPDSSQPRRRKQKNVAVEMVKVVLGGIAGLVLAYLFLSWIRPDIDPLGLLNHKQVVKPNANEIGQRIQSQRPQRPRRNNQTRNVKQTTTEPKQPEIEPAEPTTTPETPQPSDSSITVSAPVQPTVVTQTETISKPNSVVTSPPATKPEDRSLSTLIKPKTPAPSVSKDFPSATSLPSLLDRTPHLIASLPQPASGDVELALLSDAVDIKNNGRFRAISVEDNVQLKWQTVIETAETEGQTMQSEPIAAFTIEDRELQFQWLDGVNNVSSAARQLQNCVLEISNGTETHSLPLRTPVESDDYTLVFEGKVNTHLLEIEYPPKTSAIFLELADLGNFPTTAAYRNQLQSATVNRELAIQLADLQGAEIQIKLIKRTDGSMSLLVSPVCKSGGGEFELTPERLKAIKDGSTRALAKANQDLSAKGSELRSLQSQYNSLSRQSGGNSTEQFLRSQQMGKINARAKTVTRRLATLQKNIVELKARIAAVPEAEALVNRIHNQAKLPFRVYALINGQETDLLRSGWN